MKLTNEQRDLLKTIARESIRSGLTTGRPLRVDLDRLEAIATAAEPVRHARPDPIPHPDPDVRIAIARDAAFCFYYPDDLEAFVQAGAALVPFSPISDAALPENVDGLFLGGGFPETHMAALAANASMRESVRRAIRNGLPAYAECGGLMYLAETLSWKGEKQQMCGVVPARAVMNTRPQGRGTIRLAATGAAPWSPVRTGDLVAAHEFHYASLHGLSETAAFAWEVRRGHGITGRHDGVVIDNLVAGFTHLRNTRQSPWVRAFVDFVRRRHG